MNPLLAQKLKRLEKTYSKGFLETDPVGIVRRYEDPSDKEIAGLIVAAIAYGNVKQIRSSAEAALAPLGSRPSRFIPRTSAKAWGSMYRGFVHRWTRGRDIASLFRAIKSILKSHGSIERFFLVGDSGEGDLVEAVSSFSQRAIRAGGPGREKGFRWLLPDPANGSAAKRLFLYLRWMVRPEDGVDMGIWSGLDPSRLIVPLDTHLFRIGWGLGLTDRRTPNIKAAREITASLRMVDSKDPVRFDFALARLGILNQCLGKPNPESLDSCPLSDFCRHSDQKLDAKAPRRKEQQNRLKPKTK